MTFYGTYVLLINVLARLFGALAFVAGSFGLLSAYAFLADRWTHLVADLVLIAVGVAVFIAPSGRMRAAGIGQSIQSSSVSESANLGNVSSLPFGCQIATGLPSGS